METNVIAFTANDLIPDVINEFAIERKARSLLDGHNKDWNMLIGLVSRKVCRQVR
jgi:hypothetical protein